MPVYHATAIAGSIFWGKVKIFNQHQYPHFDTNIDRAEIDVELTKLKKGIDRLESDIQNFLDDPDISQLDKDILNAHLMIVTDIDIIQILENAIIDELMTAPQAVYASFEKIIQNFESMENSYFAQRADDFKDVAHRLLMIVLDKEDNPEVDYNPDDIVFLHEITPSLVSYFSKLGVKAYCIERGSCTSHSSILTRALGMTALVTKEDINEFLKDGETAILDTAESIIIIKPDSQEYELYRKKLQKHQTQLEYLNSILIMPSVTLNKINIPIKANIEFPREVHQVLENRCDGIGLFRTEFLYLNRSSFPDEEEQTKVYADILEKMSGKPVVIRTFDLGGDKLSYMQQYTREENPYLGCRGIRFSLEQNLMFKTQVRAILRASIRGKAAIMFPMIIGMEDFNTAKIIVHQCMSELENEDFPYDKTIPIGTMIETPSAALCSEQLAKVCDFFSLGTNDLVQYTLAVDRNNDKVAPFFIQHHPAVIFMIKRTIAAAKQAGIPVSICGEMASDPKYIPLLVGLGIEEISLVPAKAVEIKAVIRNCDDNVFETVNKFDFNSGLDEIEHLINHTFKPYYTIKS